MGAIVPYPYLGLIPAPRYELLFLLSPLGLPNPHSKCSLIIRVSAELSLSHHPI